MKLTLQITLDTADLTIDPHGNLQEPHGELHGEPLNLAPPSIHQTKINDKT